MIFNRILFFLTQLKCYGEEDHDSDIPHLLHSINVTQVDMEFINLSSNKTFESPRIGAEFILLATESTNNPFTITKRKTVDDEHTPGTFTLIDIISPDARNGTQGTIHFLLVHLSHNTSVEPYFWLIRLQQLKSI